MRARAFRLGLVGPRPGSSCWACCLATGHWLVTSAAPPHHAPQQRPLREPRLFCHTPQTHTLTSAPPMRPMLLVHH